MQISFILTRESVRFNGHFSRWTWVSRYQNVSISDFIGAKDGGSGGDNRRYKTCKAPVIVKLSPPTNQHPFFAGWMPFLSPNQQCQSTEAKSITYPKVTWVSPLPCLWPLLPWGRVAKLSDASTPSFIRTMSDILNFILPPLSRLHKFVFIPQNN